MSVLPDAALDTLFRAARSALVWHDKPVSDDTLHDIYELAKLGPTASNAQPMRIVFIKSDDAKARLKPHLNTGNIEKCMTAPAIAVIAYDEAFYTRMPALNPHNPDAGKWFEGRDNTEFLLRNGTLGGAYVIMAARALGLDVRPMTGFKAGGINTEFFADTPWRVNFICCLGYGDASANHPRAPRLPFTETCRIL